MFRITLALGALFLASCVTSADLRDIAYRIDDGESVSSALKGVADDIDASGEGVMALLGDFATSPLGMLVESIVVTVTGVALHGKKRDRNRVKRGESVDVPKATAGRHSSYPLPPSPPVGA